MTIQTAKITAIKTTYPVTNMVVNLETWLQAILKVRSGIGPVIMLAAALVPIPVTIRANQGSQYPLR